MLAALTIGKPKYAAHDALMKAVALGAGETAERLLALADADAQAYDAVSAAYKLPKATPAEQATRAEAIQAAMKGAIEPPLKVMEECLEAIGLAKNAVAVGNVNAASDGAAGAEFCRSAMTVASYNVRINLVAITDAAYAKGDPHAPRRDALHGRRHRDRDRQSGAGDVEAKAEGSPFPAERAFVPHEWVDAPILAQVSVGEHRQGNDPGSSPCPVYARCGSDRPISMGTIRASGQGLPSPPVLGPTCRRVRRKPWSRGARPRIERR